MSIITKLLDSEIRLGTIAYHRTKRTSVCEKAIKMLTVRCFFMALVFFDAMSREEIGICMRYDVSAASSGGVETLGLD